MWFAILTSALAAAPAWTLAPHLMVGASARLGSEAAHGLAPLGEVGVSAAWIDSASGDGPRVGVLRPHLKLGADWQPERGRLYLGPRGVVALLLPQTSLMTFEIGGQAVAGWKGTLGAHTQLQLGVGGGWHWFRRLDDGVQTAIPVPVVELRMGRAFGTQHRQ